MFDLDTIIGGGVAGGIVTIIGGIIYILLNKRVRTPADDAVLRRADIVERNEMLAEFRLELTSIKGELKEAKTKIDSQDDEIDGLKQEALERDHYIYRCIHVIQRLGTSADIPEPNPFTHK